MGTFCLGATNQHKQTYTQYTHKPNLKHALENKANEWKRKKKKKEKKTRAKNMTLINIITDLEINIRVH